MRRARRRGARGPHGEVHGDHHVRAQRQRRARGHGVEETAVDEPASSHVDRGIDAGDGAAREDRARQISGGEELFPGRVKVHGHHAEGPPHVLEAPASGGAGEVRFEGAAAQEGAVRDGRPDRVAPELGERGGDAARVLAERPEGSDPRARAAPGHGVDGDRELRQPLQHADVREAAGAARSQGHADAPPHDLAGQRVDPPGPRPRTEHPGDAAGVGAPLLSQGAPLRLIQDHARALSRARQGRARPLGERHGAHRDHPPRLGDHGIEERHALRRDAKDDVPRPRARLPAGARRSCRA